jgi:hypothetical protein
MPKNKKKGKGAKATEEAAAQTDDDFDNMLAEVCAADLTISAAPAGASGSSSSSSVATPSPMVLATLQTDPDEATIIAACIGGDCSGGVDRAST